MKKCTLCVDRIYNETLDRGERAAGLRAGLPDRARGISATSAIRTRRCRKLVAERGGCRLMPELGYKPVNRYLPPRPRRDGCDAARRRASRRSRPREAAGAAALARPRAVALTMQDWADINRWRKATRAELIERRMQLPLAARRAWSAESSAISSASSRSTAAISSASIGRSRAEFDPRPMMGRLLAKGRRAVLPVVLAKKQPMEFRLWTPASEMEAGIWDIPQPKARSVVVPDIVLSPLVGFDPAISPRLRRRVLRQDAGLARPAPLCDRRRLRGSGPPRHRLRAAARHRDETHRHGSRRDLTVAHLLREARSIDHGGSEDSELAGRVTCSLSSLPLRQKKNQLHPACAAARPRVFRPHALGGGCSARRLV